MVMFVFQNELHYTSTESAYAVENDQIVQSTRRLGRLAKCKIVFPALVLPSSRFRKLARAVHGARPDSSINACNNFAEKLSELGNTFTPILFNSHLLVDEIRVKGTIQVTN